MVWRTSNFLDEAGDPLNTKNIQPEIVGLFRTVSDVIIEGEVNKENKLKLILCLIL